MAQLPASVSYGKVVGQFLLAVGDNVATPDGDTYPDAVPAQGYVTFNAAPDYVLNTSSGAYTTIYLDTIVCPLDANGYLTDPAGAQGVWLVATDDPDNNPTGWTYTVTITLTNAPTIPKTFSISVASGSTQDLTTITPVADSAGTPTIVGPAGPANTLSIGTVTTGVVGAAGSASITGTSPNQILNLTLPVAVPPAWLSGAGAPAGGTGVVGDWYLNLTNSDTYKKTAVSTWTLQNNIKGATGATGPANTLTIGTVTTGAAGSSASSTITGTSPNQTLNLTIPRGDTGATGPANSLSIGTVTQGTAAATITGTAPTQTLNLTLPPGPANTLTIGTVTTLAAGASATSTITGTAPNQTLDLGIPAGVSGGQWLNGTAPPATGSGIVGDWYLVTSGAGLGDVYKKTGVSTWSVQGNIRGAAGTMAGPASSVADNIASFTDATGATLKDSGIGTADLMRLSQAQTVTGIKTFPIGTLVGATVTNITTAALHGRYDPTVTTGNLATFAQQTVAAPGAASSANYYGFWSENGTANNAQNYTGLFASFLAGGAHRGSGTVASMAGFQVAVPGNSGGGTITNYYGVYVPTISTAGITNTWSVYTGTNPSLFGGTVTMSGGLVSLGNGVANLINFNSVGTGLPAFTTRTAGSKVVLYASINASQGDYALGVEPGYLWNSVPTTASQGFKWYGGTTLAATLTGVGALSLTGGLTTNGPSAINGGLLGTPWNLLVTGGAANDGTSVRIGSGSSYPNYVGTLFGTDTYGGIGTVMADNGLQVTNVGGEFRVQTSAVNTRKNVAYTAKTDGSKEFTVAADADLWSVPPGSTFTVGANTYTVRSAKNTAIRVVEAITAEAATGTLTGVLYAPIRMTISTAGGTTFTGAVTAGGTGFSGPGANITGLNASNLGSGTIADARLPARLGTAVLTVTDANLATSNGWYRVADTGLNMPSASFWFLDVVTDGPNYLTQTAHEYGLAAAADSRTWRRHRDNGVWDPWYRLRWSEAELDARYVGMTGNQTIAGTKTFSSEIVGPSTGNVLKVGDDSRLADVNVAHTLGVVSYTDANQGGIQFGSTAGNWRILGTGTTAAVTGSLTLTGTVTAGGTGFSGPGANITGLNASNLGSGTVPEARLPSRLQATHVNDIPGGDWNNATASGWYASDTAINGPVPGAWTLGHVEAHLSTWCTQTVHLFTGDSESDTKAYRRDQNNGTWGTWYRIRMSETELDTRYAQTTKGGNEATAYASGTSGTVTLDCATANFFDLTPTGAVTSLVLSNPAASGRACTITLLVRQGATPYSIATPSGGVFFGAASPTQVANKKCLFTYMTSDGGSSWFCSAAVQV